MFDKIKKLFDNSRKIKRLERKNERLTAKVEELTSFNTNNLASIRGLMAEIKKLKGAKGE